MTHDAPLSRTPDHAKVCIRVISAPKGNRNRTFTRYYATLDLGQQALAKLTAAAARAKRPVEVFVVAGWCDAAGIHERRWQVNSTRMSRPAYRCWPDAVSAVADGARPIHMVAR